MPELPEVETICRQLEPLIVGKRLLELRYLIRKVFGGEKEIHWKEIV